MGEGTMGGCQGWVRGPWGLSGEGEGTMGGCQGWVRGPWGLSGVIPGGRRPPIGTEGPQLAKRACRLQGRENEGA